MNGPTKGKAGKRTQYLNLYLKPHNKFQLFQKVLPDTSKPHTFMALRRAPRNLKRGDCIQNNIYGRVGGVGARDAALRPRRSLQTAWRAWRWGPHITYAAQTASWWICPGPAPRGVHAPALFKTITTTTFMNWVLCARYDTEHYSLITWFLIQLPQQGGHFIL